VSAVRHGSSPRVVAQIKQLYLSRRGVGLWPAAYILLPRPVIVGQAGGCDRRERRLRCPRGRRLPHTKWQCRRQLECWTASQVLRRL